MIQVKPYVGQVIYRIKIVGLFSDDVILTPVIVKSVGRKYFVCGEHDMEYSNKQYHLSDWREKSDYSETTKIYFSESEYFQEKEKIRICKKFGNAFENGNNKLSLSLEQLVLMDKISKGIFDF